MAKEVERKFLLDKHIPLKFHETKFIKQGYIFLDKNKQLRIRVIGEQSFICLKYTKNITRDEYEYEVPLNDGKEMLSKCEYVIEKYRSTFKPENMNYSIDIDTYPHGITVAEVEFENETDSKNFEPLEWFGKEITGNKTYSNITLAKKNLKF